MPALSHYLTDRLKGEQKSLSLNSFWGPTRHTEQKFMSANQYQLARKQHLLSVERIKAPDH
jgi:hypothetical protein